MDTFLFFLILVAVIGGGLLIWSYTKNGKEWLKNL